MSDVTSTTEYDVTYLTRFIEAFNNGFNITEACQYAGVSRMTYYRWIEDHPEFADKVEEAKLMPNRKAKEVVVKAIVADDINASKWWLEHKDPDFKNKATIEIDPNSQKLEDKIKDFLDDPANRPDNLPNDSPEATEPD